MIENVRSPTKRAVRSNSQIIGFRLPEATAKAIKMEAARRQLRLNDLLREMWELYCERKRAG